MEKIEKAQKLNQLKMLGNKKPYIDNSHKEL